MKYPRMTQVEVADHETICRWYRFLKAAKDAAQTVIMTRICDRFKEGGGMTSEISKKIGWDQ